MKPINNIKELQKSLRQKLAVICYAVNEFDEVLLLERKKEPFAGKLVPPGGKVEPGEKVYSAVFREFFEETGLKLNSPEIKVVTTEIGPEHYNWILFIFKDKIKKDRVNHSAEGELRWVKRSRLNNENLSDIDKKIIPYIFEKKGVYLFEIEYNTDKEATITSIERCKLDILSL
ncbi:NUDIX domain-containing protein [Thermosipho ferrireducens]|uniref:NUDIX domain-containing protein n=1 Tax=Thermosipho ferrireducens TaxID=2571116 RepID=UPI001D18420E|nr:NUDIX domain-containing protein [Thermosipho ferrireducens]